MSPVIDIHEHIDIRRGFIGEERKEPMTTADDLVRIMDKQGIDKMAILPLVSPEIFLQSPEEAMGACDQYPDRFVKFCNVDPRWGKNRPEQDFVPLLEYFKGLGGKGIGEVSSNLWWDDPRVQRLLAGCEKTELPLTFHIATQEFNTYGLIDEPGLPGVERALKTFPKLQFLGHSQAFWSEISGDVKPEERGAYPSGPVKPGGVVVRLMREYPNLWGDLSAGSGFNAVARDPAWGYRFIEEFQDRLLMGLDLCRASNDSCPLLGFLREAAAKDEISREAYNKVMGGNAVKLLGL